MIIYWISRAYTEAHKWGKPLSSGVYHLWRLVEVLAIIGAVMLYQNIWTLIGMNLIGMFIYERVLCYRLNKKLFKDRGQIFDIGLKIPRYPWQDYMILIVGIYLLWI